MPIWWQICHHVRDDQEQPGHLLDQGSAKGFESFPQGARDDLLDALTIVAEGGHPSIAKPLQGLGAGVLELALKRRGDAYRVVYAVQIGTEIWIVYAVQIGTEIWIVHAFQKKSKSGIATPKPEIDLVRERLKRLKEALQ